MTSKPTLTAKKRDETGKGIARRIRAEGRIPAVMYGHDVRSVPLTIDAHEAEHLFRSISVDNTIVGLKVEGQRRAVDILIREIQAHPVRGDILHVDFLRVRSGVAVEVDIPVHLTGSAVGVRDHGGILEQVTHDVRVKCVPAAIPEVIELEVSGLEVGDSLHVSDMVVPEGVEILVDPEQMVCAVAARRAAPEEFEVEVEEVEVVAGEEAEEEGVEVEAAGTEEE
jgi:large subunit ribosomal protein L25